MHSVEDGEEGCNHLFFASMLPEKLRSRSLSWHKLWETASNKKFLLYKLDTATQRHKSFALNNMTS